MQNSASTGNLTAEQIARGLSYAAKLKRLVTNARKGANKVREYFKNLRVARIRRLIYFMARIRSDRHRLSFEELTERERIAVIDAMAELKEIAKQLPDELSHDDAKLT